MSGFGSFASGAKEGFLEFGKNVSSVVNALLLTGVYFAVIGPLSIMAKVTGKRFLDAQKKPGSYWNGLEGGRGSLEQSYKQF